MAGVASIGDEDEGDEDVEIAEEPGGVLAGRREGEGPRVGLRGDVKDDEHAKGQIYGAHPEPFPQAASVGKKKDQAGNRENLSGSDQYKAGINKWRVTKPALSIDSKTTGI